MISEMITKLNGLKGEISDLGRLLTIEEKRKRISVLEEEAGSVALWEDPGRAQRIMKELKGLEQEVNLWEGLRGEAEDLSILLESAKEEDIKLIKELEIELKTLETAVKEMSLKTLFTSPYDKMNAILSINAGAGGTDAQDWASLLLRMYTRFCEKRGFSLEIPEISYGEEAGIKSATIIASGPYAYGYIKAEKGIHRLVRISPYSAERKRHTSFASVEIIPEIGDMIEVTINLKDLRIDTFRASGPGGQHVNKTDSAVRITHIPTGTVAQSQSDRSQHANREAAMKILRARLHERLLLERKEKIEELRGVHKEIAWGNQIRSYVFHPYTMVKDHRTGVEVGDVNSVMDGDLDPFIEAYLRRK